MRQSKKKAKVVNKQQIIKYVLNTCMQAKYEKQSDGSRLVSLKLKESLKDS
jgi:hypothetical protein